MPMDQSAETQPLPAAQTPWPATSKTCRDFRLDGTFFRSARLVWRSTKASIQKPALFRFVRKGTRYHGKNIKGSRRPFVPLFGLRQISRRSQCGRGQASPETCLQSEHTWNSAPAPDFWGFSRCGVEARSNFSTTAQITAIFFTQSMRWAATRV